jgi:hypothetical protein
MLGTTMKMNTLNASAKSMKTICTPSAICLCGGAVFSMLGM